MTARKLRIFAQLCIGFSLFGPLCAMAQTYQVEKAAFADVVEASCDLGDELVEGRCGGDFRAVSPLSLDVDYPVEGENHAGGYRCRPVRLRADQLVLLTVGLTCKKSLKTAANR